METILMPRTAINAHAYRQLADHILHVILRERPSSVFVDVTRKPLTENGEVIGEQVTNLALSFFPEGSQVSVRAATFVTAVSEEGGPHI
jgi:hypothetical protein